MNTSKFIERSLWALCALAVGLYFIDRTASVSAAEHRVAAFEQSKQAAHRARLNAPEQDQELWSQERIDAYERLDVDRTIEGLLHIPKLSLSAPIGLGTDDQTLNASVGRVDWGASLGETGNLILAGHRDSFFRQLGQLKTGDRVQVEAIDRTWHYEVSSTAIVDLNDVDAVQLTNDATITLITCYPFYFVGPAPQRYLVFGRLVSQEP